MRRKSAKKPDTGAECPCLRPENRLNRQHVECLVSVLAATDVLNTILSGCYIKGKLRTRKWQAQDGTDKYMAEVVADEMQSIGGSKSSRVEPEMVKTPSRNPYSAFDQNDDEGMLF